MSNINVLKFLKLNEKEKRNDSTQRLEMTDYCGMEVVTITMEVFFHKV